MKTDKTIIDQCNHDLPLSSILLRRTDIDSNAKGLYCELCCHANRSGKVEYGIIRARTSLLLYNLSFLRRLKKLQHLNLLSYYKEDRKDIVLRCRNKNLQGKGWGWYECEWCGIRTTTPEDHHYPKTRKEGGKSTVTICQNCHNEYHHPQIIIQLSLNDTYKEVKYLMSFMVNGRFV